MSTETQKSSRRPSHRLFAIYRKSPTDKGFRTEIGAVWPHKTGTGFSLKLDYLPLNGADIVAFAIDEQTDAQEGGAQ
jgi:hypothetical protein